MATFTAEVFGNGSPLILLTLFSKTSLRESPRMPSEVAPAYSSRSDHTTRPALAAACPRRAKIECLRLRPARPLHRHGRTAPANDCQPRPEGPYPASPRLP